MSCLIHVLQLKIVYHSSTDTGSASDIQSLTNTRTAFDAFYHSPYKPIRALRSTQTYQRNYSILSLQSSVFLSLRYFSWKWCNYKCRTLSSLYVSIREHYNFNESLNQRYGFCRIVYNLKNDVHRRLKMTKNSQNKTRTLWYQNSILTVDHRVVKNCTCQIILPCQYTEWYETLQGHRRWS